MDRPEEDRERLLPGKDKEKPPGEDMERLLSGDILLGQLAEDALA